MNFSKLNQKIVFLKPDYHFENSVGETVPAWVPFHPYRGNLGSSSPCLTVTEGDFKPRYAPGVDESAAAAFKIWARVLPVRGREYEAAQMLRSELTYKVKIRYSPEVWSDFKILYNNRILNIESVINVGSRCRELEIVCYETESRE